jgi:hypothetical protein
MCCFCSVIFWYRKFKQANEINLLRSSFSSTATTQQQQYGSFDTQILNYESAITNSQTNDYKTDILPTYDEIKFKI